MERKRLFQVKSQEQTSSVEQTTINVPTAIPIDTVHFLLPNSVHLRIPDNKQMLHTERHFPI